jgi:hypothetical protein
MRKRILNAHPPSPSEIRADWLPLDQLASVEVTSETASHPIEAALIPGAMAGLALHVSVDMVGLVATVGILGVLALYQLALRQEGRQFSSPLNSRALRSNNSYRFLRCIFIRGGCGVISNMINPINSASSLSPSCDSLTKALTAFGLPSSKSMSSALRCLRGSEF